MKKLSIITLSILFLFVTSCAKEETDADKANAVAEQFEGTWNITSMNEDGEEQLVSPASAKIIFSNVVDAKGDYRIVLFYNGVDVGIASKGDFEIIDAGKKFTLSDDDEPNSAPDVVVINSITDSSVELTSTDEDGKVTVIKATKI